MTRANKDKIVLLLIYMSAIFTFLVLLWILGYIMLGGIKEINLEFLFTSPSGEDGGIFPMIITTLYLIIISIGIAAPIGILSAIYLVEYAKNERFINVVRFATESLASVPSIIYGLFGMVFFVTFLKFGWSIISGAITVSIMILPTIIRTTEEALKSVPNSYREASLALGATKFRTIFKCVLPSAISGIVTGIILSVGRVVGETAAIYLTMGMAPYIPKSIFESGRTLSVHLYMLSKEGISFEKAFATATILIIIILIINLSANYVSNKLDVNRVK